MAAPVQEVPSTQDAALAAHERVMERRYRTRLAVTITVVGAVVLAALVGVVLIWLDSSGRDLDVAQDRMAAAVAELSEVRDEAVVVFDETVDLLPADPDRTRLGELIEDADEVLAARVSGSTAQQVRQSNDIADEAEDAVEPLRTLTAQVGEAGQKEAVQAATTRYQEAAEALSEALSTARQQLDGSAGGVLDEAPRTALNEAIVLATAFRAEDEPTTAEDLLAAAEEAAEHTAALDEARQGVIDAQVAWQTEQSRVAAEQQAAADAAAAQAQAEQDALAQQASQGTATRWCLDWEAVGSQTPSGDGQLVEGTFVTEDGQVVHGTILCRRWSS